MSKLRNKYGARKTACWQGHTHASKREAARCNVLADMQRKGEISHLEHEVQFWFSIDGRQLKHDNGRRVGFKADFVYRERPSGKCIVEDAKGYTVRDWPLRKAVFRALWPEMELREV